PAGEVRQRLRLGLEGVRVAPRRAEVLELVADEPEPVVRLQVVAGRGLAVAVGAAREEAAVQLEERRRGRDDAGAEEERDYECGKADAAASSSSKSGTSPVSYRHAPLTVPSASIRNAARPDTSRSWRKSCPMPKPCVASPFQSESSPKSRSS